MIAATRSLPWGFTSSLWALETVKGWSWAWTMYTESKFLELWLWLVTVIILQLVNSCVWMSSSMRLQRPDQNGISHVKWHNSNWTFTQQENPQGSDFPKYRLATASLEGLSYPEGTIKSSFLLCSAREATGSNSLWAMGFHCVRPLDPAQPPHPLLCPVSLLCAAMLCPC